MVFDLSKLLRQGLQLYSKILGVHPAADLFPMMDPESFEELVEDVKANGFLHPLRVTDDGLLIDGRNRLCASVATQVTVGFERYNPVDPVQYVISENLKRRHLTSQQRAAIAVEAEVLIKLLEEQAKERQREALARGNQTKHNGESSIPQKIAESTEPESSSSDSETREKLAKSFQTNREYVQKAKKIKQHAPELLEEVKAGTIDLNEAAKVAKQRERETKGAAMEAPKAEPKTGIEQIEHNGYTLWVWHDGTIIPKFNTANHSIDWAWSTWNPVTGCLHSCHYCYARDIATSERMSKVYPKGFEPVFHPYRLEAPGYTKPYSDEQITNIAKNRRLSEEDARIWAKNVFVCSMADLFGKWVPDDWILSVFESVVKYDHWNYLFLTKYPQRLQEIGEKLGGAFPDNCWVGTTVDEQKRVRIAQESFAKIKAKVKWLSLEPLLTNLEFTDLGMFDMVAIGGQSSNNQVPDFQPEWLWVENIVFQARKSNTAVYFKENLRSRPKELPALLKY